MFADLRTNVHNFWDRGLLGMALHPNFPETPYVYVLYTFDAPIGGAAPTWGVAGETSDDCPTPPGPVDFGCVASGRLSRLRALGNEMVPGSEEVLINDWFQQFPGHSVGGRVGDTCSFGDVVPVMLIAIPLFGPLVVSYGVDPIHFGVVLTFAILLGIVHPPIGLGIFAVCAITKLRMEPVVRATLLFYPVLLLCMLLLTFVPELSTWLPKVLVSR